jgi:N6-L-threonylcarbamoyladenine synthase
MPTNQAKARHLIKGGKAKVVKRFPFTIQLTIATGETKQPITLGVDSGYRHVGLSAVTDKKELFSSEVELRTNIVKLLSERRMYRRNKRNRLWYREPRWNNRVSTKKEGWLAPSIKHKLDSHIMLVDKVNKFLPITKVIVEVANFDIQKIINPEIKGEGYQEGVQSDFWNTREYVLHRDNHECQHCKGKDLILNVHHIESRQTGGDRPDNLITLCKSCHDKFHKGKIRLDVKKLNGFKAETFMSMVRWKLVELLKKTFKDVGITFGYRTKSKRIELGLDKSHSNDAFVIANGTYQIHCHTNQLVQKRRNNRCTQIQRNGFNPSIKRCRYKIQPNDLVVIKNMEYTSLGMFNKGTYVRVKDKIKEVLNFNVKMIQDVFHIGGLLWN